MQEGFEQLCIVSHWLVIFARPSKATMLWAVREAGYLWERAALALPDAYIADIG